ncbi:MAG TPA: 1,4-dihydroxy-2-naphthoate polyprenyltransferase, partial [Virgibacillus sp.]|nr:1,4-dihydroxy-2-naphthoate polyprenyltransferase [Virgibacillus sp.]
RDLDGDKINGRKTIAILIGRKNAIRLMAALFIIAYTLTILYIILGILPILSIIVLLSSKKAIDVVKNFQGKTKPIEMLPAMIATGKTNTMYGFLLGLSLLISHFI